MLQFLAIDTHGPLVALSDAHLMAAALHILARVLGGVHGCEHKNNNAENTEVSLSFNSPFLSPPHSQGCGKIRGSIKNLLYPKNMGWVFLILKNSNVYTFFKWYF